MESFLRVLCIGLATGLLFATLGEGTPIDCCQKTSTTRLQLSKIKHYHMQKVGLCPVDAVVFTTVKDVRVCSDPRRPWVKKAVRYIDSMKQKTTAVLTTQGMKQQTTPVLTTQGMKQQTTAVLK
ncbi:C-C motif chemokine 12-like isoform X1 [Clupea harengus]|uniref:C-C motif chemokine n=1 Tax=Clupea harengus TaxID=7950 RepID=A0A6P8GL73_CLUHA|nr:C-C motif chemokine 12-like isoform X1 [Clupea harengus]